MLVVEFYSQMSDILPVCVTLFLTGIVCLDVIVP